MLLCPFYRCWIIFTEVKKLIPWCTESEASETHSWPWYAATTLVLPESKKIKNQKNLSAYSASTIFKICGDCSNMKYSSLHCGGTDGQVSKTGQRCTMIKAREKCVLLSPVIETSCRNQWERTSAVYWLEWSKKAYGVCETWQRIETSWMEGRIFWLGEWLKQECKDK